MTEPSRHILERLSDENDALQDENRKLRLHLAGARIERDRAYQAVREARRIATDAQVLAEHQTALLHAPTALDWAAADVLEQILEHLDHINGAWHTRQGYDTRSDA